MNKSKGQEAGATTGVSSRIWRRLGEKPFAQWVIFGSLYAFALYWAAALSFAVAAGQIPQGNFIGLMTFVALFLVAGALSLLGKRGGFALAAGASAFFFAFASSFLVASLTNFASPTFRTAITGIPLLTLVIIFSILALVNAKGGIARKRYLGTPRSAGGLLTTAVVGFVVGGLLVGSIAAGTVGVSRGTADVTIVLNAAAQSTATPFSPATFTLSVGGTVTWHNADFMSHSVTSDTGVFDSGLIAPGGQWSHTFTTPGTYPYHCEPHPWMKGSIIVSN